MFSEYLILVTYVALMRVCSYFPHVVGANLLNLAWRARFPNGTVFGSRYKHGNPPMMRIGAGKVRSIRSLQSTISIAVMLILYEQTVIVIK